MIFHSFIDLNVQYSVHDFDALHRRWASEMNVEDEEEDIDVCI